MAKIFILAFLISITLQGFSQKVQYKNEFGFRSDNDSYLAYGQDRYYTNGLFISFKHAIKADSTLKRVDKKIWEAEVGQYMYNPYTGRITNYSKIDRPFAAYSYMSGKLGWFFKDEQIIKTSISLGTIGPSARGKEAQETLHDVIGFYKIRGWETQVKDEVGLNIEVDYSRLLKRSLNKKTDFNFDGNLNLGNTFSSASAGVLFRAGSINPFNTSVSSNSRISNSTLSDTIPAKELFFFARPSLNFIAYDATIQGGMFSDNKGPITFDPKRIVFSQQLGVMYAKNRWTLDFSIIFKSREINSRAKAHQYGSASIFYRFN